MAVNVNQISDVAKAKADAAKAIYDNGGDKNAELKAMIGDLIDAINDLQERVEALEQ